MSLLSIYTGSTALTAFLASLVECVEALTVVLAVGVVRGWKYALSGAVAALVCLSLSIALVGSTLMLIPLHWLQLIVGLMLLVLGLRWLRKAVLRSAGILPLHDETAVFLRQTESMNLQQFSKNSFDSLAFFTTFKVTVLEGIEVVLIVIAIGGGKPALLHSASVGALIALISIVCAGILIHRPLAKIPENTLKFTVGILISAFGTFWIGEGIHIHWLGDEWFLLILVTAYWIGSMMSVAVARPKNQEGVRHD